MNIVDRARFWLARGLVKAAGLPIVTPWITASFIRPTFRALVDEGYKKNAAVWACLSALAFSFPEPPITVSDERDGTLLAGHPMLRLLRRPNAIMGEAELKAYSVVYMGIGGNAYWHKVRSKAGQVVELWPYHAGQMRPVPGGPGWIKGYEYSPDGSYAPALPVPAEDVIHFKWPLPDPDQPWQALPPLVAAARDVDSANEITRYLYSLLKNDAIPRTAITVPANVVLDDPQYNRLKAQWKERYGGDNRGEVAIIEGGAVINRIGLDMKELDFGALYNVPERHISAALRVPMFVAGIGEDPIYANSSEARLAFTETTLATLWTLFAGELQNALADTEYHGGVTVGVDLNRVAALAEKMAARRQWALAALSAGGLLLNEFRAAAGYAPLAGGDVRLRGLAVEEVPLELAPSAKSLLPSGMSVEMKARRAGALKLAAALQRIRKAQIRGMEQDVGDYFETLAGRMVSRLEKAKSAKAAAGDLFTDDDAAELETVVKRWYVEICSASWETWNTALGVELAFDLKDPAVTAALKTAGGQIRQINATTRTAVQELLQFASDNGWSVDQIARGADGRPGLRTLVAQTYKDRARTIARTELGTAQQTAASARYQGAGVKKVLVLDNGFDDSDPVCQELGAGGQGTVKTLEWAQKNPLQHPNCVRAFAPWFED